MAADRAEEREKKTIGISKQTDEKRETGGGGEREAGSDKATMCPGGRTRVRRHSSALSPLEYWRDSLLAKLCPIKESIIGISLALVCFKAFLIV